MQCPKKIRWEKYTLIVSHSIDTRHNHYIHINMIKKNCHSYSTNF